MRNALITLTTLMSLLSPLVVLGDELHEMNPACEKVASDAFSLFVRQGYTEDEAGILAEQERFHCMNPDEF